MDRRQRGAVRMRLEHGEFSRGHVSEVQRMRILSAMATVACEQGIESASVARVVKCAGVSRRTFYDFFESRSACFLVVFDEIVAQATERVELACSAEGRWVDRVRAGLLALLSFLDEEPALARACVVQALAGGPLMLARRAQVFEQIALALDRGRAELRHKQPPPMTAEGVVGAVFSIVHGRLQRQDPAELTELLGSLMSLIVLPYAGRASAQRELARSTPKPPPPAVQSTRSARELLEGLDMRITYRTLRVLGVIAEQPGVSNRVVAQGAEITDQGQMSRLLTRLQDLGLIENTGAGHMHGATNAWCLTDQGLRIQQALEPVSK